MSEPQILNEKIRKYKEYLAKPYCELQAGVSILCEAPEYISLGSFDPKLVTKTGKGGFEDEEFWIRFHAIFKIILDDIENKRIDFRGRAYHVHPLSEYLPTTLSRRLPLLKLKIQSRFVYTYHMVTAIISKGFDLPEEFQHAANIFVLKDSSFVGKTAENHVMAEAICHYQWYKKSYPDSTMDEHAEGMKKIVKSHYQDLWVPQQNEDLRKLQTKMRPPKGIKPFEIVPGIIERTGEFKRINYHKLKITLETLGKVLLFHERINSVDQLYSHPLIACYLWDDFHKEFAVYCLADIILQLP